MLRKVFPTFVCLLLLYNIRAQSVNPLYQSLVSQVSYDSVLNHLQVFESFGTKSPGSSALINTRNWLINKYYSFGYADVVIDTFQYNSVHHYNIIVTKTGTYNPGVNLVVCGHYDTKSGPGTNDNGSGVCAILEAARILASLNTAVTVKFIHFGAEEQGMRGSINFVNSVAVPTSMNIKLVFNIDEVGGVAGIVNNSVRCERDQAIPSSNNAASAVYTDTLAALTGLYTGLNTTLTSAYGSDYIPFQQAGYVITGYYEGNESSYVHSASDNLAHLDTSYVFEISKAVTAAVLYFAGAWDPLLSSGSTTAPARLFNAFPNPFCTSFNLENPADSEAEFVLYNSSGMRVMVLRIPAGSATEVNTGSLPPGIYFIKTGSGESAAGHIIKLIKL